MFGKNIKNILFMIAIVIILYGAYNALFGNVESMSMKKIINLRKRCSKIPSCKTAFKVCAEKNIIKKGDKEVHFPQYYVLVKGKKFKCKKRCKGNKVLTAVKTKKGKKVVCKKKSK